MATVAEPRPAELPLKGGRPEARVRLHPFLTGRAKGPLPWFLREEGRMAWRRAFGLGLPRDQWLTLPVPAFLIEHPAAGAILVDTGLHPSVAVNPRQNLGRMATFVFKDMQMEPEEAVSARLRARDLHPSEVRVVIMTHLHMDHASAIVEFPEATFIVSGDEWEAATDGGERDGYVRRQFDHGFDYRLVDFGSAATESFAGFGRSLDLFGDGSVRLVSTPGHSAGHMSVVLRADAREVLLAGDAIYLRRTLDEDHLPYRMADEHLFRRSLREIRQYAKETPGALIVPGHDWEAWQQLEPSY